MSVNAAAVVGHRLRADEIHTLPDLLTASWREVAPLLPIEGGSLPPGDLAYQWRWQEGDRDEVGRLIAESGWAILDAVCPDSVHGLVHPQTLYLAPYLRWSYLLTHPEAFVRWRNVCRHIAAVLGGGPILYLPDSSEPASLCLDMATEGAGMDDLRAYLLAHCGPPAAFEAVVGHVRWEDEADWDRSWYLEEVSARDAQAT